MQADRLDALARAMTTARSRRGTLGIVLSASLGVLGVSAAAGKKPHRKPKKRKPKKAAPKQLGQACTPGRDTCSGGLKCDTPTTRHTCSSSIPRGPWCCVPPGGACSECSCCGDFYCEFDNNNQPHCVPNPEG